MACSIRSIALSISFIRNGSCNCSSFGRKKWRAPSKLSTPLLSKKRPSTGLMFSSWARRFATVSSNDLSSTHRFSISISVQEVKIGKACDCRRSVCGNSSGGFLIFASMLQQIHAYLTEIANFQPADPTQAEQFRIRFLGRKGLIPALFEEFKALPPEEKRILGKDLNQLKQTAEEKVKAFKNSMQTGTRGEIGRAHV